MLTEKQLISKFQTLKEIKPRKEWAFSLKSQILSEPVSAKSFGVIKQARSVGILDAFSAVFTQRKLAYSLATLVFIIIGIIGFAEYTVPGDLLFPIKKLSEQSQANLTGQSVLKQDVVALSNRINDLAQVAKGGKKDNIPLAISEISVNVSVLVKSLKENPTTDQETIKEIAISLKTLANVPGTDLTESQEVKDLYQTVVKNQIADLKKTTLTDEQKKTLTEIEDLYNKGKYADALEKTLLINK